MPRPREKPTPRRATGAATAGVMCDDHSSIIRQDRNTSPLRLVSSNALIWDDLVELEPRLNALLHRIQAEPLTKRNDPLLLWYGRYGWGGFKHDMSQLVGWERRDKHPILSSPAAYDVAYRKLLGTLERRYERRRR